MLFEIHLIKFKISNIKLIIKYKLSIVEYISMLLY